jgi:outer membrane murein-binding lipoprotein Lpp
MKTTIKLLGAVILGGGLFLGGCAKQKQMASFSSLNNPEVAAQLKSFVAEKEAQANATTNERPSEFNAYFAAAAKGDWLTVSNTFLEFQKHAGQYEHSGKTDERLRGPAWQAVMETWGALDAFGGGDEKYSAMFGNDIIQSIPPGSIYFGGTDPGRFLVTAMCKSQVNADPIFVLTQNALADSTYLDYLRAMYGGKIYIPTPEDSQRCFQDYVEDVQQRLKQGKLMPGEDVHVVDGKPQVRGQVAVMNINGLLVKTIFDKTPDREFYIEESFPLDWMYPYLEPHGLILKLNRQPLAGLSEEMVSRDHEYWARYVTPMIGGWLHDDTPVGEVAAFVQKTFGKQDFAGFTGDPRFIQNAYAHRMFSKLRSSIAGLYAWRVEHPVDAAEKQRMIHEADFAFRQAWALCPYSPEAVFRYVNFLLAQNRGADALLVAETAAQMPAMKGRDGEQLRLLVKQLKTFRKAK